MPHYNIEPMLLTKVDRLPLGEHWAYEAKWDGYRMLASVHMGRVVLTSRHGITHTDRFPSVAAHVPDSVSGHSATIDGEIVAFNEDGTEDFDALRRKRARVAYHVFDLLHVDGHSLMHEPLRKRREYLDSIFVPQTDIRLSTMFDDRDALLVAAKELGLEGVVAKNLDSPYRPGTRSRDWQKQILRKHPDRTFGRPR